jgi:hypothetical protein
MHKVVYPGKTATFNASLADVKIELNDSPFMLNT